jgi:hypothetical protein
VTSNPYLSAWLRCHKLVPVEPSELWQGWPLIAEAAARLHLHTGYAPADLIKAVTQGHARLWAIAAFEHDGQVVVRDLAVTQEAAPGLAKLTCVPDLFFVFPDMLTSLLLREALGLGCTQVSFVGPQSLAPLFAEYSAQNVGTELAVYRRQRPTFFDGFFSAPPPH